jgi:peptidoglycan L-alanyl-D-glutamate endopeptidase CwlK
MINSRSLDDLDPDTKAMAERLVDVCAQNGIRIIITSTFRDRASQDDIYAQGRTKPGMKVTNAQGGRSFHQYRCAFDFCPLDMKGNPSWNDLALFKTVGAIGKQIGLKWGGDFKSFVDMPHFQHDRGQTLAQWSAKYPAGERGRDW